MTLGLCRGGSQSAKGGGVGQVPKTCLRVPTSTRPGPVGAVGGWGVVNTLFTDRRAVCSQPSSKRFLIQIVVAYAAPWVIERRATLGMVSTKQVTSKASHLIESITKPVKNGDRFERPPFTARRQCS